MKYLLYAEQNYAYTMLRPLQDAILKRGDKVAWFLAGKNISSKYLKEDERQLESVNDVVRWKPDAVLAPGNFIPSFIPGIKVAIFHGLNSAKATRKHNKGFFNVRGCFDLYCTHGPNSTSPFQELEQDYGFFQVKETGLAALDPLFHTGTKKEKMKPTVLFCSTFTTELTAAPHLFNEIKKLSQKNKWHWIVQFHPKMQQDIINKYKDIQNKNLEFIETDNIIPLLKEADVMVSDTSGVMLMFMVQSKPVVTFRNQSHASKEHLIDIQNPEALEKSIERALLKPEDIIKNIDEFMLETHPYKDGKSSERVLNAVESFLANEEHKKLKKKPLNLLRNFKERKKLSYWGF